MCLQNRNLTMKFCYLYITVFLNWFGIILTAEKSFSPLLFTKHLSHFSLHRFTSTLWWMNKNLSPHFKSIIILLTLEFCKNKMWNILFETLQNSRNAEKHNYICETLLYASGNRHRKYIQSENIEPTAVYSSKVTLHTFSNY